MLSVSIISFMSDASIDFHPAIEEPSNIKPSSIKSVSTWSAITVTCCSLPLGSVNLISTYSMFSSEIVLSIVSALMLFPLFKLYYSASDPLSRVLILIACSTELTNIFPSPILSVLAASIIASIASST